MAGISRFVKTAQVCGNEAEILAFLNIPKEQWGDKDYPEKAILVKFDKCKGRKKPHITVFHDYGSDIQIFKTRCNKKTGEYCDPKIATMKWEGYAGTVFVSDKNKDIDLPIIEDKFPKEHDYEWDISHIQLRDYPSDFSKDSQSWFTL